MKNFGVFPRTIVFVVWLCVAMASINSWATTPIPSWQQVYDELASGGEVLNPPFDRFWTNSATLRRLVEDRNSSALLELSGRRDNDLAPLAAYFALRSFHRKSSLDVGFEIALSTSVVTNPFVIHVIEALANDLPQEDSTAALTRAFCCGAIYPSNARMLISVLPEKVLREWFEDTRRPPCLPTYEALVLDRLYLESRKRGEAASPRMTNALEQYFFVPGVPRMIFTVIVGEKHPLFRQALRLCLEDPNLTGESLTELVEVFASAIEKNIDVKNLNLSGDRRRMITDLLGKAKRLEFPQK